MKKPEDIMKLCQRKWKKKVIYSQSLNSSLESMADSAAKQMQEQKRHNQRNEEMLGKKIEIKLQMLTLDPN